MEEFPLRAISCIMGIVTIPVSCITFLLKLFLLTFTVLAPKQCGALNAGIGILERRMIGISPKMLMYAFNGSERPMYEELAQ